MTVINDTRVVRLQRTAARTGHQHSGDQPIVETVTKELVTAADVVSLPPGSLITLQRGPGAGLTEEGSVLNVTYTEIGGVTGGQSSSVTFNSEDADVTANAIFATEIDFSLPLSNPGEYAVNYKTFQVKTYTSVPTTVGQRTQITYTWAPIREYLEWDPEDVDPDLVAFGVGPHQAGGAGGDAYVAAGCNINVVVNEDGYKEVSVDLQSIAGEGLVVAPTDGCPRLDVDLDAYQVGYDDSGNRYIFADNVQDAITEIDGYLAGQQVRHVRKLGSEASNYPFNTVYELDGYEYPRGQDRLIVYINGIAQFEPQDWTEHSTTSIETAECRDMDDVIDILVLPGSLGGGNGGTTTLQNAYDNSPSGTKNITLDDGQITFAQTLGTGSALRLISSGSVTPTLVADQSGSGQAARLKSVDGSTPTLLIQKDTVARNTTMSTVITERTTSHILGGQMGIGSAWLTRLESSGTNLFDASKIITGSESVADAAEKTYLAIELSDDGSLVEHTRFTSDGSVGINTTAPDATLHVQGDGYLSQGLEVAGQLTVHNTPLAPLHLPVLTDDPPILKNGDTWISDIGGTRKINVRIGGTTYSVQIT